MSDSSLSSKKHTLLQTLNKLPTPMFEEIRYILGVPQSVIPSSIAPQASRAVALLEWAESPVGCGIHEVSRILSTYISDSEI